MTEELVITLNKENFIKGLTKEFIVGEFIGKYKLIFQEDFFADYTLFIFSGALVIEDNESSYMPTVISYDELCKTKDGSYRVSDIVPLVQNFIVDKMNLSKADLEHAHFAMYINETEYMDLAPVKDFILYIANQLSTAKMHDEYKLGAV